jgi:hypothetical protein
MAEQPQAAVLFERREGTLLPRATEVVVLNPARARRRHVIGRHLGNLAGPRRLHLPASSHRKFLSPSPEAPASCEAYTPLAESLYFQVIHPDFCWAIPCLLIESGSFCRPGNTPPHWEAASHTEGSRACSKPGSRFRDRAR